MLALAEEPTQVSRHALGALNGWTQDWSCLVEPVLKLLRGLRRRRTDELTCIECGGVSRPGERGWEMHRVDPDELAS
jgi:hypothetical protein